VNKVTKKLRSASIGLWMVQIQWPCKWQINIHEQN